MAGRVKIMSRATFSGNIVQPLTENTTAAIKPPPSSIISPTDWTTLLRLEELFPSDQPLEVDIGCGKGRFLTTRARACPDTNFLGIDRLLRRLHKVERKIQRQQLSNVRLLRIEARYAVTYLLPPASVSVFYVFFPDPWPKRRHHKRRLLTPGFLDALDRTLVTDGQIHLVTDDLGYLTEIRRLYRADARFTDIPAFEPQPEERTEFERIFREQAQPIGRCSFAKRT